MAKKKTSTRKTAAKPAAKKPDRTERAMQAAIKKHRGEKLSQSDSRDLAWWEKSQRESIVSDALVSIPKGLYCQLAGRQHKVIDDAAERFGLPIGGATIDLFDAIESLHTVIADNSRSIIPVHAIDTDGADDEEMVYKLKLAELQEKVRKLQVHNERQNISLTHDRGDSIDRQELRRLLQVLIVKLRAFGQQLRRASNGQEAQKACNEFLSMLAKEVEEGDLRV
ncbi:hypothetical protein K227x_64390 [Rubripirellula lacrimiformis]|uniref:Uncharacterized protein n=1 Tax=Rubripirellula lacrimiformis TaxID=1930273 RepID=A0A517NLP8_9BACT|nr:hypothetical protein [Rubripirellula lacrimiformis]QDT08009.1 hypothetical protein K227x_64390 [Rubripirellula lacrimiformis]